MWSKNTIKSRYIVKNKKKYIGNLNTVTARSSWERTTFKWVDNNPKIIKWASESVKIPYISPLDKKVHTYIVDMILYWDDGNVELVEIKPRKQTIAPKPPSNRRTKKFIRESQEYAKNMAKWQATIAYVKKRGWNFSVWHEDILKAKGIRIIKG